MIILQRIWEKWSKKASDTTGMVPVRLSTNNFITNFSTDCNLLTTCCVYILKTTCHMTRLYLIYALIVILAVGLEVDTCCMSASPSPWHLIHGWLLRETVIWRAWHLLSVVGYIYFLVWCTRLPIAAVLETVFWLSLKTAKTTAPPPGRNHDGVLSLIRPIAWNSFPIF